MDPLRQHLQASALQSMPSVALHRCNGVGCMMLPCRHTVNRCYLLVYKSLHGAAPDYLKSYCVGVSTSRAGARQRSEVKGDLKVRKSKTCFGDRAFSVAEPQCWNNIPTSIRSASNLASFKSRLETHYQYFKKSYL